MKTHLLLFILMFAMSIQIGAVERLIDRNSTDPLELAIERALTKLLPKIPENVSLTVKDIEATHHDMIETIHDHFENILMTLNFSLVDRNQGLFVRNPYTITDDEVENFFFVIRATDKDIYMVLLCSRTGDTIEYAVEHF